MSRARPLVFDVRLTVDADSAWRVVRLSSGATLERARRVFCVSLGWNGGKGYAFAVGHLRYAGSPSAEVGDVRLRQLLTGVGDALEFEYGDALVEVRVVGMHVPGDDVPTPRCLGGAGQGDGARDPAPEDDVGERRTPPQIPLNLAAINAELQLLR